MGYEMYRLLISHKSSKRSSNKSKRGKLPDSQDAVIIDIEEEEKNVKHMQGKRSAVSLRFVL